MNKIIYIIILSLFLFHCDKSDDDEFGNTFLEKYEGTVWLKNNLEQTVYIRFINNTETPLEYWVGSEKCYHYFLETIYKGNSLSTNFEDVLELRYVRIIDACECVNLITISVFEDSIILVSKNYEDNNLTGIEIIDYIRSYEDVDSFIICKT